MELFSSSRKPYMDNALEANSIDQGQGNNQINTHSFNKMSPLLFSRNVDDYIQYLQAAKWDRTPKETKHTVRPL